MRMASASSVQGDGDEHGTEDLLSRKAPVVRHVRENGGDRVIAFAKRSFLGRKAPNHNTRLASVEPFVDVAAHLLNCFSLITVPMSLASSSGSPSLSALTFCPSASRNSSKISRWRKRR